MERGVASRGGVSQPLAVGARHPPSGHYTAGVRGVRWDHPDVQSGEGKAPARPKIATVERREASVSKRHGRLTRALGAPQGALRGCRSTRTLSRRSATPHFGCAKPKAKPMQKKRRCNEEKKYVLFDKGIGLANAVQRRVGTPRECVRVEQSTRDRHRRVLSSIGRTARAASLRKFHKMPVMMSAAPAKTKTSSRSP